VAGFAANECEKSESTTERTLMLVRTTSVAENLPEFFEKSFFFGALPNLEKVLIY